MTKIVQKIVVVKEQFFQNMESLKFCVLQITLKALIYLYRLNQSMNQIIKSPID